MIMTQKEKAKAYDGLIERLKDLKFAYRFSPLSDTMEEKFPELKESEDERIRKWIIENIQETLDVDGFFEGQKTMAKNAIAWLEKQGEQNHAWSEEDEKMLKVAIESCEQCGNEYAYYWLKSLKDRVQPQPKQE